MHSTWNGPKMCTCSIAAYHQNRMGATNIFRLTLAQDFCTHDFWLMLRACALSTAATTAATTAKTFPFETEQERMRGNWYWALSQSGREKVSTNSTRQHTLIFQHFPWMRYRRAKHYKLKALDILSAHSYKAYINIWHFCVETVAHSGMIVLLQTHRAHVSRNSKQWARWVNWKTATMENIWLFIFQWITTAEHIGIIAPLCAHEKRGSILQLSS